MPAAPLVGRGDHAPAGRVLLVHGQRVEGDPLHRASGSCSSPPASRLSAGWPPGAAPAARPAAPRSPGLPRAHALLHHRPDVQQPGADLVLGAPRQLVGQHDPADAQPGLRRALQELVSGGERVRHAASGPRRGRDGPPRPGRGRTRHRPSSTRVPAASAPLPSIAAKSIPLVWNGSRLRRCRTTSSSRAKAISCLPPSRSTPVGAHGREPRLGGRGVDEVGSLALEPEHDGLDRAVAVPGGSERAEHLRPDPGGVDEQPVGCQTVDERVRGPHRPDRVRARRADADLVQVEGADGHAGSFSGGSGSCRVDERLGRDRGRERGVRSTRSPPPSRARRSPAATRRRSAGRWCGRTRRW